MQKSSSYVVVLASFLLSSAATSAAAPTVNAPPLPRGSERVSLQLGQNPAETARSVHAHKRPIKDKQRDDTLPTTTAELAGDAKDTTTQPTAAGPSKK